VKRILGTAEDYRRIYGAAAGGVSDDDEIPVASPGEPVSDVAPQPVVKKSPAPKKKAAPAKPATRKRRAAA
jgi:hypothetical protein